MIKLIQTFQRSRLITKWYIMMLCIQLVYLSIFILLPSDIIHKLLMYALVIILVPISPIFITYAFHIRFEGHKKYDILYESAIGLLIALSLYLGKDLFTFGVIILGIYILRFIFFCLHYGEIKDKQITKQ